MDAVLSSATSSVILKTQSVCRLFWAAWGGWWQKYHNGL